MKNKLWMLAVVLAALLTTACSGQPASDASVSNADPGETAAEGADSNEEEPNSEEGGVLIAYFTRFDNTDAELDEIIRGGGPYGELGNSMDDADLDAVSSASITIYDGQVQGNTQTIARMIQEQTGGDLFSIRAEEKYPADYDELIDIGGEEEAEDIRPELISHVENMEDYEIVFLGFPNWWSDMPMAVYSFLEEYDFTGKTVIPFAVTAGSGFSDTISTISDLLPEADVVEDGLHIPMEETADAQSQVEEWLAGLGF